MKSVLIFSLATAALAAPQICRRQTPCFVIGSTALPEEVQESADSLASTITCNFDTTTINGVPDVTSNGVSFSSINFADSDESPLTFALSEFATTEPLADNDLDTFQNQLNTYLATEAGIRSVDGSLAIKVPKFFLQFQIARIQQAQGITSDDPADTVDHQLEKVLSNAAGEDQDLLDQVNSLATELS